MDHSFGVMSKIFLTNQRSQISSIYFSRGFTVSDFTLRSMIDFNFFDMYESSFGGFCWGFFFGYTSPLVPTPFVVKSTKILHIYLCRSHFWCSSFLCVNSYFLHFSSAWRSFFFFYFFFVLWICWWLIFSVLKCLKKSLFHH